MRKVKMNLFLGTGYVLFSLAQIAMRIMDTKNNMLEAASGFAAGIILTGVIACFLPPKLRQRK